MIKIGQLMAMWLAISAATSVADAAPLGEDDADLQLEFPLGCIVRDYKFVVVRQDGNGAKCRGKVETKACFGSCETGEYGTHKFPQREQTSNICAHDRSSQQTVMLTDCDAGVDPAIKVYTFKRAETCKCQPCNPTTMHCQSMAGKRAAPPGRSYKSEDGVFEKRRRVVRFLAKLFAAIDQVKEYDDN